MNSAALEDDWVRREIAHAIAGRKSIIPVMKEGFVFPPPGELPGEIADLPQHSGIRYSHDYFDAAMDRLAEFLEAAGAPKSTSGGEARSPQAGDDPAGASGDDA